MVDFPLTAEFLTAEERNYVMWTKSTESLDPRYHAAADHSVPEYETSSVGEEEHFEARHIGMAVTDWQLWLHILLAWSIVGPRRSRFLSRPSRRLINWRSLRDLALLAIDHPRVRIFSPSHKPSHGSSVCPRK